MTIQHVEFFLGSKLEQIQDRTPNYHIKAQRADSDRQLTRDMLDVANEWKKAIEVTNVDILTFVHSKLQSLGWQTQITQGRLPGRTGRLPPLDIVHCVECKFWDQSPVKEYAETAGNAQAGTDAWDPVDLSVGRCLKARHVTNTYSIASGFEGPMAAVDGSGFMAALYTKDTHGCVAGVRKEDDVEQRPNHQPGG